MQRWWRERADWLGVIRGQVLTDARRDRDAYASSSSACGSRPHLRTTKRVGEQRGRSRWRRCWGLESGCVHGTRCIRRTSNLTLQSKQAHAREHDRLHALVRAPPLDSGVAHSSHSTTVPSIWKNGSPTWYCEGGVCERKGCAIAARVAPPMRMRFGAPSSASSAAT